MIRTLKEKKQVLFYKKKVCYDKNNRIMSIYYRCVMFLKREINIARRKLKKKINFFISLFH
jgi:hypothetical protein